MIIAQRLAPTPITAAKLSPSSGSLKSMWNKLKISKPAAKTKKIYISTFMCL
jgi:hypothetical protein